MNIKDKKIKLTEAGEKKVYGFIEDLEIKRSELINAGYADEDDETFLPTEEDIICDIYEQLDNDGEYSNGWNATENCEPDILTLTLGKDFIVEGEETV